LDYSDSGHDTTAFFSMIVDGHQGIMMSALSSLFPAGRLQNKEKYKNITAGEGTIQIRVL